MNPRIALINDTSLYSSHFGCHLVCQTIREQLKRVGLDLVLSLPKTFDFERTKKHLANVDLVIVNGEGSIHHGRNLHLVEIAKNFPSALINCVYQDNPECDGLKHFRLITARESLSTAEIEKAGAVCTTVPDVIFASSLAWSFYKIEPKYDIGITDNVVKEYRRIGPIKRRIKSDIAAHEYNPASILYKLSSYRRICAGRYHAAVLATILDIPFIAWESNTWKTKGMLEDMGLPHLWNASREEAVRTTPTVSSEKMADYAASARKKVERTFDFLSEIAGKSR